MDFVRVKLFDTPLVVKNEETIVFPFKKAEALFYYLLVHKQASRDTLVNILWGEVEEKTAKKNLRQAMYKIRKAFDMDIVISPKKSLVMINPDIQIDIDLYHFLNDKEDDITVYKGEFLKGFHVKDGDEFESWMLQYREYLKDLYIEKLNKRIENAFSKNDFQTVISCAKKMIEVDDFDEKAYQILMKAYRDEGQFHKAIDVYNRLEKILYKELGVEPDLQTRKLLDEILIIRNTKEMNKRKASDFFYGRVYELGILNKNYELFKQNKESKSLIIMGEAGVGKTKLKDRFLKSIGENEIILLKSNCYQAEKDYLFKPWNEVFTKLVDIIERDNIKIPPLLRNIISHVFPSFAIQDEGVNINPVEKVDSLQHQVIEEAMITVLKKVSQKRKILLVFEDIQWIDDMSLSLLNSILLHQENDYIFFIGTCRNAYEGKLNKFITAAIQYNRLEKIILNRFNKEQVREFVNMRLPKYSWNENLYNQIYQETEGNAFFLTEVLNSINDKGIITQMTTKMQDILRSRFLDISKEGKKLLYITSLFFDKVSLDMLRLLSSKDVLEIMDIIEELQNRGILREVSDSEEISFTFTHQKLREFIYLEQSSARRKILHNQIGLMLEKKLHHDKRDRFIYPKLIYHFENGGNQVLALKYRMKNLDVYFNFTHEMFPVFKDGNIEEEYKSYLSQKEASKQLKEIEKDLKEVIEKESTSNEIKKLQIEFFHMRGRYLIQEGEYEKGIRDIQSMIDLALQIKDADYALKGYRQMIYYGIQTYNVEWMQKYIDIGLNLAKACNYQKDTGIMLRLKGLEKIMIGDYEEAEDLLKQSIRSFEVVNAYEDKYTLNMAAGYNYIGEIRRHNMKFMSALEYYERAVSVCAEKKVIRGLTIFYTNAGQAAYDMGDDHRAKNYFKKAIKLYNQLDTLWGRSTAEGYMALLLIKEGEYKNALKYLIRADKYANKLKSPYELGLLYRVKAEVKVRMKENEDLREVFKDYLTLDIKKYCEKGISFLKQLKDPYEIGILEVLKKNS
ncbi:AAA family ATPase [Crassaminicella thermophila]|uniref:AAA family ATPase n=1 Tax=Crassaminicella thermophila TaxID=2599308 RepID=A0A5C0SEJ9_CRATE|nr:BTAD domain-containing putative transcriptional regulator [Crassaminicella thermophila]QEK13055.1 AAA family ATPase [Crassaminicella thermophila]